MSQDTFRGTIGTLAEAAGVTVETIRFYQRKQLLAEPTRRRGEVRQYGADAVARVRFVKAAQRLGFSLVEIAGLLTLDDGAHCGEARVVAEGRLNDVRAKLRDLRRMKAALDAVVADCRATRGTVTCPLIASLHATALDRDDRSAGRQAGCLTGT